MFTYYVKGKDRSGRALEADDESLEEIKMYFKELEPRALNRFTEKVYRETEKLIEEYEELRVK